MKINNKQISLFNKPKCDRCGKPVNGHGDNFCSDQCRLEYCVWKIETYRKELACIYVVKALNDDIYKIGYSTSFENRLKKIQSTSPFPLVPVFVFQTDLAKRLETLLHNIFVHKQTHGEWFHLELEDICFIQRLLWKFIDNFACSLLDNYTSVYSDDDVIKILLWQRSASTDDIARMYSKNDREEFEDFVNRIGLSPEKANRFSDELLESWDRIHEPDLT